MTDQPFPPAHVPDMTFEQWCKKNGIDPAFARHNYAPLHKKYLSGAPFKVAAAPTRQALDRSIELKGF